MTSSHDAGAAPLAERTLVVAVGSNASPDVMRCKFARAGVDATVPFVRVRLGGIAVGHSAHVSLAGYVAAAPYHAPGATATFTASLLDDDQLECLDETERTYTRLPVDPAAGGPVGAGVAVRVGAGRARRRPWLRRAPVAALAGDTGADPRRR